MSSAPKQNDATNRALYEPTVPAPDPDIAGIGVIISFAITIVVTLGLCRSLLSRKQSPKSLAVKRKVLLGFSDQLLVTAIGIQIAALIKIAGLSIYHHNIVTTLATLSTVTHFLTIISLKEYFQIHHLIRRIRIFIMSISLVLVLVNTVVAQLANFKGFPVSSPVLDVFSPDGLDRLDRHESGNSILLNPPTDTGAYFLTFFCSIWLDASLIGIFIYVVLDIMYPSTEPARLVNWLHRHDRQGFWTVSCGPPVFLLLVYSVLLLSEFGFARSETEGASAESQWGYGQICSMLLLLIPILNAISIYSEEWDNLSGHTGSGINLRTPSANNPLSRRDITSGIDNPDSGFIPLQDIRRRDTEQQVGDPPTTAVPPTLAPRRMEASHQD